MVMPVIWVKFECHCKYIFKCSPVKVVMDKVSGRGAPVTQSQASRFDSPDIDVKCDICSESVEVISAVGFCLSCNEFMCSECIKLHNRFKANKDHTLLKGEDMPRQRPTPAAVETCSKHQDRPLEMYCTDDDVLGCAMCFAKGHRTCSNVDTISNLSNNMEKSSEMLDIQEASKKQTELCKRFREVIQEYRLRNDQCRAKCLEDYRGFRTEIEVALDRIGEQIAKDTDNLQKSNSENLDSLAKQISSYEQQMDSYMSTINGYLVLNQKQNEQNEKLFIAVKKNQKQIVDTVNQLEQLSDNMQILEYEFQYPHFIKQFINNECKVKRKSLTPATMCTDVHRINIKTSEDKNICLISGIVAISEKLLILSDEYNTCLKMVDAVSKMVIKRQILPSSPWDITSLPGSRVAVSLPDTQQIRFFTADQNLDPCGTIEESGKCLGLHCFGEELVVSYRSPEPLVKILDLNGTVIRSIHHDLSKQTLFQWCPEYLTVSDDNRRMYVTDDTNHTLTCMDEMGVVQWEYKDAELKRPTGVTTGDNGCIYITSWENHTIHVVSRDGVRLAVIPQSQSGVFHPYAVCYSSDTRSLFVSSSGDSEQRHYLSRLNMK